MKVEGEFVFMVGSSTWTREILLDPQFFARPRHPLQEL